MDFAPTDTQRMIADAVTALLADQHDFETRRQRIHSGATRSVALWSALGELGVLGAEIDEAHGGTGGPLADLLAVMEPCGAALVNEPLVASLVLSAGLIQKAGTPQQKARYLPDLATGARIAATAHSERRARDTLAFVETTATRTEAGWRLDGGKQVVAGGDVADLFVISARTSGAAGDAEGLSLFVVAADAAGLTRRSYPVYDGSGAADLTLDGVAVAEEALLGEAGQALPLVEWAWDRGAAAVCVEAVGAMQALRDLTLDYIKTREQFGQPIGKFQVLQHRMADLHMQVELSRSMALLAISATEEADADRRAHQVSAAKTAIATACREVGQSAVQLHGGVALTEEYAAGHYFKRLTLIERQFGDRDHHLARYARLMA